jgi:hypothetical protein
VRAVQTCFACPSQWDAWTSDGTYLYLRYRSGHGTVQDKDNRVVASFTHGDEFAGHMGLREFCRRAGVGLASECGERVELL